MNVKGADLHLGEANNRPFRSHQKKEMTYAPPKKSGFIRKSQLNSISKVYSSRRKRPYISVSPDEDDPIEPSTNSAETLIHSSTSPHSAFKLPPQIDCPAFDAILKSCTAKPFQNPDDIKASSTPSSPVSCFIDPSQFDVPLLDTQQDPRSRKERTCKFCQKLLPPTFAEEPPIARRARFGYCQRHEDASVLQEGHAQRYPSTFDFTDIERRILATIPEIRKLIKRPLESEFLTNLRQKISRRTAATPMIQITIVNETQPGYYGPRGAELMTEIMMNKLGDYIGQRRELLDTLKFCGGVIGYISSVLVPEVAVRLIMEDKNVEWAEAKKIMKASVAYGNVKNPAMEVVSDGDSEDDSTDSASDRN